MASEENKLDTSIIGTCPRPTHVAPDIDDKLLVLVPTAIHSELIEFMQKKDASEKMLFSNRFVHIIQNTPVDFRGYMASELLCDSRIPAITWLHLSILLQDVPEGRKRVKFIRRTKHLFADLHNRLPQSICSVFASYITDTLLSLPLKLRQHGLNALADIDFNEQVRRELLFTDRGAFISKHCFDPDFLKIQDLCVAMEPALRTTDSPISRVALLRNLIYQKAPLDNKSFANFSFYDYAAAVKTSLAGKAPGGHLCQGLSNIYLIVLKAFKIPSRHISVFSNTSRAAETHSSVEVYIDGHWMICDPTFNCFIKDLDGNYLSWEEVRSIILVNREGVSTEYNGFSPKLRSNNPVRFRTIENYYIKLPDLARYLIIGPCKEGDLTLGTHTCPSEWDGILCTNTNGEITNSYNVKSCISDWSFYSDLAYAPDPKLLINSNYTE